MNNKYLVGALVVIALLVSGLYLKDGSVLGASGTRFPNGISADSTSPVAGEVRGTTLTITGAMTAAASTLSGLFTPNAGTLRSYTLSTSTDNTATTMILSDFNGYDTIAMQVNLTTLTLTFPASSTIPTFLPTAGDMQETCWLNATSTAGINLVFAGGTGWDMQVASSTMEAAGNATGKDLTISPNGTACFKFIRKVATGSAFDIEANLVEYEDVD